MNSIADEIDFAPYLLWNIIMPLTTERRHKLFAASSAKLGGEFSNIVAAKDEAGKSLMRSVVLGKPCDACLHSDAPHMCTHNDAMTAGWKCPLRSARTAKVYKACGRESALMAELYSTVNIGQGPVFNDKLYSGLFAARPNVSREQVDVVYVGVDPAGRGSCEFAITAIGSVRDKFQILAMCRETVFGLEERVESMVYRMFAGLRNHPRVGPHVPYIVAIEACGQDAMYLASKFHAAALAIGIRMCVMREMKNGPTGSGWGVPKHDAVGLVAATQDVLSQGLLSIPDDCLAVSSDAAVPQKTLSDQRNELMQQFMSFKKNPDGTINGKHAGSKNDDLIITLMMAIFWGEVFCQSDRSEYGEFKMAFSHLFGSWASGTARSIAMAGMMRESRK